MRFHNGIFCPLLSSARCFPSVSLELKMSFGRRMRNVSFFLICDLLATLNENSQKAVYLMITQLFSVHSAKVIQKIYSIH